MENNTYAQYCYFIWILITSNMNSATTDKWNDGSHGAQSFSFSPWRWIQILWSE